MFTKRFWADLAERSFWTFGEAFFGLVIADVVAGNGFSWQHELGAAALAGGLAVGKSVFLGRNVGNKESASTLPATVEP